MTTPTTRAAGAPLAYRPRRGMTLIEIMIAITLLAVIGASLMRVMTSQLRFADSQISTKDAREVARSALNALTSDVRMVDADSGFLVATADSFTVLAPYAEGLVCGTNAAGTSTVIALLPYDSVSYAEGGYAGYAYIDTTTTGSSYTQVYQYKYSAVAPTTLDSATAANNAPCKTGTDKIGIFHPGAVLVQPVAPDRARYQAAILFRKVTYAFRTSTALPGRRGLYRTIVNGPRGAEELVAPFDAAAKFSYYLTNGTTASAVTGSTLRTIRGIEMRLDGAAENVIPGKTAVTTAPTSTAIFFKNRPIQ